MSEPRNSRRSRRAHEEDDDDDNGTGVSLFGFIVLAAAAYGAYKLFCNSDDRRSLGERREEDILDRLAREEFIP